MTDNDARGALTIPDGWKLVPIEPTRDMWDAVNKLDDQMAAGGYDGKGCSIEQAWNCLLDHSPAAPKPPAGDGLTQEQLQAASVMMSRHSRAMLLNVLWHHQGGSSPVGQSIRALLGIERFARMSDEQVSEAKWIDRLLAAPRQPGEMGAGVPTNQQISDYLNGLDAIQREVVEREARSAASAQQDERRTVKFPDAEGKEVSAYLTFDELAQRFRNAADELVELRAGKAAQQDEREAGEPPLGGRWHHGNGVVVCGTLRVFGEDFDTDPAQEFKEQLLKWVCDTLNAAQDRAAQQVQADALDDGAIREIVNQLRDIAINFHDTQQLRARIASVVVPRLKAVRQVQADAGAVAIVQVDRDGRKYAILQADQVDVGDLLYTRPAAESDKK